MKAGHAGKNLIIGFDGDDTLWHNENILWSAEQKFQQILLRYLSPEEISQKLYEIEMRNLSLFGYGAKGFVLSMIETAIEVTKGRIAVADIETLIGFLKEIIQHPVHLIDNSAKVVEELSQKYNLILISKGELFHQELKVASSGLADFFIGVEIVSEKNEGIYRTILEKYDIPPSNFIMIGNSLRSDIDPILKLGARAIHIPYEITWKHERLDDIATHEDRHFICTSISDVFSIICEIEEKI